MGQQQLLIITLGFILVGIAVATGIAMYNDNALTLNRDAVQSDLANLALRAQEYFMKPTSLNGGGKSFSGLTNNAAGMAKLVSTAYSNNDNGTYSILIPGSSSLLIFRGVGKTQLSNGTYPTYFTIVRPGTYANLKSN